MEKRISGVHAKPEPFRTKGRSDISATRAQPTRYGTWTARILWLLTFAWVWRVTVLVRPRASTEFAAIDLSATAQIGIVIIAFIMVAINKRTVALWVRTRGTSTRLLLSYYAICFVSAAWAALPEYTVYRAAEFVTMFVTVILAITYCRDFLQAERAALIASIVVIALTLVSKVILQGFSLSLSHWHTNTFSASALMVFCYCLGEYFRASPDRRRTLFSFGVIGLFFVVLGTSAATNVAAVAGVVVVASLLRARILLMISIGVGAFLLLALVQLNAADPDLIMEALFPGKSTNQIVTMHGRTFIWANLFDYFRQQPVVGHGFAALSSPRGLLFAADPHSSFFSIIVGTGLVGLSVALGYGFRLMKEFRRTVRMNVAGAVGCSAAIVAALINSLAKTLVFSEWEETSVVFACFSGLFLLFVVLPARNAVRRTR